MWLLEPGILEKILRAEKQFIPTAEEQERFFEFCSSSSSDASRIMSVAGDKASISIQGVLTKKPSFIAMFFGGGNTTYSEINSALAAAESDGEVKEITFDIDSPGGQINGLFETLDKIRDAKKPTRTVVSGNALSAAYAIAAQTDEITAINQAALVGSVGVVIDTFVFDEEVSIASTRAPEKRPDLTTEEGKAVIRKQLDALHELFVEGIAEGRTAATGKTFTPRDINKDFGRGATLVARDGLKRGMVDSIINEGSRAVTGSPEKGIGSVNGNINKHRGKEIDKKEKSTKEGQMDLAQFKKEHPGVFEEAKAKGFTEGEAQERKRVIGHLVAGRGNGCLEKAAEAIEKGDAYDEVAMTRYFTEGRNNTDVKTRGDDDAKTKAALAGASGDGEEPDVADKVADEVCKAFDHKEKGASV